MDLPSFDYYADSQRTFTGRLSMQELRRQREDTVCCVYSKSYNDSGYWFVSRNILSNIFLILTHNFVVRGCEVAVNHGRKVSIVGCNYSYSVLKSKETILK